MNDPTYIKAEINLKPEWKLAFWLSEIDNDNAPIGWGKYILLARFLNGKFDLDLNRLDDPNLWHKNRI